MANITISAGDTDLSPRLNHRSLDGIPYVLFEEGGNIQAWKGNAGEPTSFAEQDAVNAPDDALFVAVSTAIKRDGVIGVLWIDDDATTKTIQYAEFDTNTDTWNTPETVDTLVASSDIFVRRTALAMDGNSIPHATWPDDFRDAPNDFVTAYYSNRIGGSWKARVAIQTGLNDENFEFYDILIGVPTQAVGIDVPIVLLVHVDSTGALGVFDIHHGNVLDATAWTDALDVSTNAPEESDSTNLSIDDAGNLWIIFTDESVRALRATEHLATQATWATWETDELIDSSEAYDDPCGTAAGRFIYAMAVADVAGPTVELRLWKREGTTWVQETADPDLPVVDGILNPKIKFGTLDKNPTSLDYIFESGGNVTYNQFLTVNPETQKTKKHPVNVSARI